MDFRVDTDTWFVFTILFLSTLGLFIFSYIAIPYSIRKKQLNKIRLRIKSRDENYKRLERKMAERELQELQVQNQKLEVNLKEELYILLQPDSGKPDLISFFSNFEKVYPNFRNSLQSINPNLSANELKLCALLRLNLSSKEIGALMNITQESVNKARYRLRKKMNLTSKEDLIAFITSI